MNLEQMDPIFAQGLRAALVEEVRTAAPARRRRHRWWVGAGVFAGIGLVGGVGAATAGFFTEPGADIVTELEGPEPASYTGTQTIEIGPRPQEATHMEVKLTCLSAGNFYFPDGGFMTCTDADTGATSFGSFPLSDGQAAVEVKTDQPDASYRAEVSYENRTPTELAVNANGDTYGTSATGLNPDLVLVIATNGQQGYAYATDLAGPEINTLEEAKEYMESMTGAALMIPVYESDGETVIGEFQAGSR